MTYKKYNKICKNNYWCQQAYIVKKFDVAIYLIDISENTISKVVNVKIKKLFFIINMIFIFIIMKQQIIVIIGKKNGLKIL